MKEPKLKLPSLKEVKDALYDDWSLRVRALDSWRCLLCESADGGMSPHHWWICDHYAKGARYCVDNGATLCYTCHVRGIHYRADKVSVDRIMDALARRRFPAWRQSKVEETIRAASEVELTTGVLRQMWDEMRLRPVVLRNPILSCVPKGGKLFLTVDSSHQIACVGNTIVLPDHGICEVNVVAPIDANFRYTLRKLTGEGNG